MKVELKFFHCTGASRAGIFIIKKSAPETLSLTHYKIIWKFNKIGNLEKSRILKEKMKNKVYKAKF